MKFKEMVVTLFLLGWTFSQPNEILREDFTDPALPGWTVARGMGKIALTGGPGGKSGVTFQISQKGTVNAVREIQAAGLGGKLLVVESWIAAQDLVVGDSPWNCAKLILFWKSKNGPVQNARIFQSDFSGTFEWERRVYAVILPENLEWVKLRIGIENATGAASWSSLRLFTDESLKTLKDFTDAENLRKSKNREAALSGNLTYGIESGLPVVRGGQIVIPSPAWDDRIRRKVLGEWKRPDFTKATPFTKGLAEAWLGRLSELEKGPSQSNALVLECASLREKVRNLTSIPDKIEFVLAAGEEKIPVPQLLFGNNINWGEFGDIWQPEKNDFTPEFRRLYDPMGMTFLRYPGGCNADVFDWKASIGDQASRPSQIYYNRTYESPVRWGLDEFLSWCEKNSVTPLLTTAFLKDSPDKIAETPAFKNTSWESYLKKTQERISLAAEWVEYVNGGIDTPMGALRAKNGHPKPYGVKYWEVGNETFGPDPLGTCPPKEYTAAFPNYVRAMKAKDPTIQVALGLHTEEWNEAVLETGGKSADILQVHHYLRIARYAESSAASLSTAMAFADTLLPAFAKLKAQMNRLVGRELPVLVTEYGMGVADQALMTSTASSILVADMLRALIETDGVVAANRWCLYQNHGFTAIQGPSRGVVRSYYPRPDQIAYSLWAWARSGQRLKATGLPQDLRAVVFDRGSEYGIVVINRNASKFARLGLKLPGFSDGKLSARLLAPGHPLSGNDLGVPELVKEINFGAEWGASEGLVIPPGSIMALRLPKKT